MLQHIPFPALSAPPSWFPGHMNQFKRQLPVLLKQTDVVLELRDARLPLTSINRTFEGRSALLFISLSRLATTVRALYRRNGRSAAARGYLGTLYTVPPHDSPLFIRVALPAPISVVGTSLPVFPA